MQKFAIDNQKNPYNILKDRTLRGVYTLSAFALPGGNSADRVQNDTNEGEG